MKDIEWFRSTIARYSGEKFIDNLPRICKDLHNELGVLTFGIIVYDETTPELRKILRDKDYWDALDKASGDRMVIFSLIDRVEREYNRSIGLMVAGRPSYSDKCKSYSHLLKELFGNEALLVYPYVIFFQVVGEQIHDYRLVPLKRKDVWESTKAIQDLFSSISDVLNNVLPEYYGNRREIFELVKSDLLRQEYKVYILQGPKKLSDFVGIIKNLVLPFI
jgi:hypothetical protein